MERTHVKGDGCGSGKFVHAIFYRHHDGTAMTKQFITTATTSDLLTANYD